MRLSAAVVISCFAVTAPNAQEWGCYDPKPGHPTPEERAAFVAEVGRHATAAERKHGVPAAAIAAMALVESGYGWTRTALNANNLFGWKYLSKSAANGRKSFELECQPKEDIGNKYVVFYDRADSVDFVAERLSKSVYYSKDTKMYRAARAKGQDVVTATRAWLAGISDPYNWRPQEYIRTISRVMNDPLAPSDQINTGNNLYRLSSEPADISGSTNSERSGLVQFAESQIRPWASTCDAPTLSFPRWKGFPVTLCDYADIGARVRTYMLNPDRSKLANWIVTACEDAQARNKRTCVSKLTNAAKNAASYTVFPVAGFIPEPLYGGKCFYFRDGVTAYTASYSALQAPANGTCRGDGVNEEELVRAAEFARLVSTTREQYVAAGLQGPVTGTAFVDRVREAYQRAWNSHRNDLISAKAKSLRSQF